MPIFNENSIFQVFRVFGRKKVSIKAKDPIFVISTSKSIESCGKKEKKFLLEVRITCTLQNVEMGYCTSKMDTYGHLGLDI